MVTPNNGKLVEGETNPFLSNSEVAIFVPEYNSGGKRDATGAFHPGASAFCEFYGLDEDRCVHMIDNTMSKSLRAKQLLSKMGRHVTRNEETEEDMYPQIYVFFCHGYTSGIQFGIRSNTPGKPWNKEMRMNWERFVNLIGRHPAPFVILYACSTGDDPDGDDDSAPGSGDDSFGDLLRDDLCKMNCWYNRVVTHTTAGHSWYNPNVKIMDGNGSPIGGHGGMPIARRGTKEFRTLAKMLKAKQGTKNYGFAWRFPFMTINDIHFEIADNM